MSVEININPPIVTTIGNSNKELKCSVIKDSEYIYSISIKSYNISVEEYNIIATFYPSDARPPLLTDPGKYLEGRVLLITNTSSIVFREIRCEDDNKYICLVNFDKNAVPMTQESSTTSITINTNSSKPDGISSDLNLTETESGHNVTFTCEGNIGKPPGKFVWKKYSTESNSPSVFSNINTTSTENHSMCSYLGSSNFTVQLSDEDNQAIIACVEERHAKTTEMEIRTNKINVYYPVKEVTVSKNPDMNEYTAGPNSHINLQCSGKGNPMPKYIWYKDGDMKHNISTLANLSMLELSVNDTGSYMCLAYNIFKANTYIISAYVNITVVPVNTVLTTAMPSTSEAWYENTLVIVVVVISGMLAIALICLFVYCCCHRKTKGPNEGQDNKGYENFTLPSDNQAKNTDIGDDYQEQPYADDANKQQNENETKHSKL